jgi:carboxylate-amine ligase
MIEITTGICADVSEVTDDLTTLYHELERLSSELNVLPYAASLHPYALVRQRHLSPGVRYSKIMDDLQMAGRRLITQALHIHIGMPDPDTAIRVCDTIRPYLPIFLALTTSSPFFEGEDSGFYSYRTNIFKSLPRSGIPETIGNWQRFQELINVLNEATLLNGIKELWWDARPHPTFGTVEIRICDLPSKFDEIIAIVALAQSLMITLSKGDFEKPPFREIMLNNKWHASRYGLDGTYISPKPGKHSTFRQAAAELVEFVRPMARLYGAEKFMGPLDRILEQGTSAHYQKQHYDKTGDLKMGINDLQREFWQ